MWTSSIGNVKQANWWESQRHWPCQDSSRKFVLDDNFVCADDIGSQEVLVSYPKVNSNSRVAIVAGECFVRICLQGSWHGNIN